MISCKYCIHFYPYDTFQDCGDCGMLGDEVYSCEEKECEFFEADIIGGEKENV